ncbi:hypothetical protein [Vibrio spartinae]|uniref:Uncharacterized protein n=1 Tax=Vibrio spartinae TaxID=1918945 RepID=A0A1N6LZH1_9VIBR|nr:hypothetical protein [Vibrio spartinae]SIO92517.1 hypothetical protein VSP9026_00129 [Vibrio spartinae]
MLKIKELEYNLDKLNELAVSRNSQQGIKIYEGALDKLKKVKNTDEFNELLDKVLKALGGIEAHGSFTNEEYECVKNIRNIKNIMIF